MAPSIIDERKPELGLKVAGGKVLTGGILGTIANMVTIYWGHKLFGSLMDDPLYYSVAASAVLAALLNIKLYGFVLLRYFANEYCPNLVTAIQNAKKEQREVYTSGTDSTGA